MRTTTMRTMTAVLGAVLAAGAAAAQVKGALITPEGRRLEGVIRWNAHAKAYAIMQEKAGRNIELSMTPDKVRGVEVAEPAALAPAAENVKKGKFDAAIPVLEAITKKYQMLTWDAVATRYLAEAYLKTGDAGKAMEVCESVTRVNKEAGYIGEMAPVYWQVLIKKGRSARAEDLMALAIKAGDRRASAFAQIARGDIILTGGDTQEIAKKALCDGYLRVVTLYRDVRAAQPEALYKAAKCFERIGHTTRADQMRTMLKNDYGASEWAAK